MSHAVSSVTSVSEAWLLGLEHALTADRGRTVHLMMTVTEPGREISCVRSVLDAALAASDAQSVETVSETIFPRSLYPHPGLKWAPDLPSEKEHALDDAALAMYRAYASILPVVLTARSNSRGTYFARMVTWPGKEAGGFNQLDARIQRLRGENRQGRQTHNTLDVDVAADALHCVEGVQTYAVTDTRTRGFPCLTHISFSLHKGFLHGTAVYRHHYLIEKAYGNLLGLSWLMDFLCQQTGLDLGELVVHATFADAQLGSRFRPHKIAKEARAQLEARRPIVPGQPR